MHRATRHRERTAVTHYCAAPAFFFFWPPRRRLRAASMRTRLRTYMTSLLGGTITSPSSVVVSRVERRGEERKEEQARPSTESKR
jgi:hypothetical protein